MTPGPTRLVRESILDDCASETRASQKKRFLPVLAASSNISDSARLSLLRDAVPEGTPEQKGLVLLELYSIAEAGSCAPIEKEYILATYSL
ncbi:hypothetical protein NDU88_007788 [Pleurodeles waltl]|uniref:Uncharacterized protein n=1 Tax=Pleurodeles waltl TaxID=8319 RepID=A0AAV7NU23_PLEWA|nr:hypothetical protein NDU88_007788 [Pleurodeles waltl]